jgi:glutamyl-tRNA synthetase
MSVRVRFAPSPTGPLHIGGVRTALYNYFFARKMGGKMILRIEDTDQTRFVPGAEKYITDALSWLGVEFDESVEKGGPHAPYKQSERKTMYGQYALDLVNKGFAYYAFDTAEELDALRKKLEEAKVDNISYNAVSRLQMRNSLTLSAEEVSQKLNSGEPYVIRLKVPLKEEVRFRDLVRDWVSVHASTIDDKVLMKSDGMPTYHLANVVDDHLMEITHVIRGEEWLPSAPLHLLLYKFFGWTAPTFAHLPLLLKPEGNGKLSKRDGVLGDFPVFPLAWNDPETQELSRGFKEDGFYPEALLNFLSFLGWNPGTDQEIMNLEEIISAFDLENIHKAGARFDIQKAKWYNQQYLKNKSDEELSEELKPLLKTKSDLAPKLISLMKDRVVFVHEIPVEVPYIFDTPSTYEEEIASKKWDDLAKQAMPTISEAINSVSIFEAEHIHSAIFEALESKEIKPGKVMQALRLAITGEGKGPDLMLIIEIIGKEEAIYRIELAMKKL